MATRPARVAHGAVFTRPWVVEMMLDLAGYTADRDLTAERVVEPSIGDGAFIGPIVRRLIAARGSTAWEDLAECLRGWDLQPDKVEVCQKLVGVMLADAGCPLPTAESLASTWLREGDFLVDGPDDYGATLVVGNPPYIRIEDVPRDLQDAYRAACPTMVGRADIFVGFYERALDMLAPEGRLVYICADRWMHNDYGKALRAKVVESFAVDTVLTMHDVDAFEASVSAYPAVVVLRNGTQGRVTTANTAGSFGERDAAEFVSWAQSRRRDWKTATWDGARLRSWFNTSAMWPTGSAETLAWLDHLRENFLPLELPDKKTMLRIGVATGNDDVFIVGPDNTPLIEPGRLVPVARSEDMASGEFAWTGWHLVDPWEQRGQLINLAEYPRAAAYFERHKAALSRRHTAKKGKWWKTIDAVHHDRLKLPYLILEDMKGRAHPVLVPPGYYPHHNLYAIYSTSWDLEVLGGILMSEVFERQVAAYCVKMRGGTLRFQAQYIRMCRFPVPQTVPANVAVDLAAAFRSRDRARATAAALRAYGMERLPD